MTCRSSTILAATFSVLLSAQDKPKPMIQDYVSAVIGPPPATLNLDPFYTKYTDALGIPVVSSAKVPDAALLIARDIVIHMLSKRPDIREGMVKAGFRVGVMAETEMTTDLPEQRNWKKPPAPANMTAEQKARYDKLSDKEYWDNRARGMGGRYTTCAEENLLGYYGAKYYGEHICVHEFSHAIMSGIRLVDPKLYEDIRKAYADAMAAGRWKGQYGSTNASEYWAEATQTWFWSNFAFNDGDKTIVTPDDLKEYDPEIYEILGRVYPDHHIPVDVFYSKEIPHGTGRPKPAVNKQ